MRLRLFAAIVAAMLIPGTAFAMDCCEEDSCTCCASRDAVEADLHQAY